MPRLCKGCSEIASRMRNGNPYCEGCVGNVDNEGISNGVGVGISFEKVDSTMLKLPKKGNKPGGWSDPRIPEKKKYGWITTMIDLLSKLMRSWPYIFTTLKVMGMCIVISCFTSLPGVSIVLYGCLKSPYIYYKSYPNTVGQFVADAPGTTTCVTALYNLYVGLCMFCTVCAINVGWSDYGLLRTPLESPGGCALLVTLQYCVMCIADTVSRNHRGKKLGESMNIFGNDHVKHNTNIGLTEGLDMLMGGCLGKLACYNNIVMDMVCCFVVPGCVFDISNLHIPTMAGLMCANIIY